MPITPGPWKYDPAAETITAQDGNIVVYELGVNEADGHLIAAAPQMYRALKSALDALEDAHPLTCEIVRIAIAEADGEL